MSYYFVKQRGPRERAARLNLGNFSLPLGDDIILYRGEDFGTMRAIVTNLRIGVVASYELKGDKVEVSQRETNGGPKDRQFSCSVDLKDPVVGVVDYLLRDEPARCSVATFISLFTPEEIEYLESLRSTTQ